VIVDGVFSVLETGTRALETVLLRVRRPTARIIRADVPPAVEYAIRGSVDGGPPVELSHEQFAYAGKFGTARTGTTLLRTDGDASTTDEPATEPNITDAEPDGSSPRILAAACFNRDHAAPETARIRYVTVRRDRRGEGLGTALLAVTGRELSRRHDRVAIAVNNPVAYRACYKAGFAFIGEETGMSELRLVYEGDRSVERYEAGLDRFRERDLPADQRAVLDRSFPERRVPNAEIDDSHSDSG